MDRESGLYGTEFEIKFRNEMTQKAIAKECADWIRKKVSFRSNVSGDTMGGFITVESPADTTAYMPKSEHSDRSNNSSGLIKNFHSDHFYISKTSICS